MTNLQDDIEKVDYAIFPYATPSAVAAYERIKIEMSSSRVTYDFGRPDLRGYGEGTEP